MTSQYTLPPGPPPSSPPSLPSLQYVPHPIVPLPLLALRGWASLDLADHPALRSAYVQLFELGQVYFALDEKNEGKTLFESSTLRDVRLKAGEDDPDASEEGFLHIPNEKQMLTLRTARRVPFVTADPIEESKGTETSRISTLKDVAQEAWRETGILLRQVSHEIACSLGLQEDIFEPYISPCVVMPGSSPDDAEDDTTPTLLRLFRYERPFGVGNTAEPALPKIVADEHKDLGLLSLVIGRTPGLDVYDPLPRAGSSDEGTWRQIEDERLSQSNLSPLLTATLLIGRQLEFLIGGRYAAGIHRVSVAPFTSPAPLSSSHITVKEDPLAPYRFSIVFALRGYEHAPIDISNFDPAAAGDTQESFKGTMGDLWRLIKQQSWNVNAKTEVRERQKASLAKLGVEEDVDQDGKEKEKEEETPVTAPVRAKIIDWSRVSY